MSDVLNILVLGAGAIGTYVGGSLAMGGNRLTFIEQPKALEVLRTQGLKLEFQARKTSKSSTFSLPPGSFSCSESMLETINASRFDVAIFALKSFDTAAFLESVRPIAARFPPILCLSNGVDNEPALASLLGKDKIIAGTVTSSVGRRGVGNVILERLRGLGVAAGHPLSSRLVDAMTAVGLNARLLPDAADMKWSKLLTNLPANATSAILDMSAAEIFDHPGLFKLEMDMLREAITVMNANGTKVIDLPGVPVRALAFGTRLPTRLSRPLMKKAVGGGRGGKMPSFHIDLHAGRGKSEVEWLNGAIHRYGSQQGIPTPINTFLTSTLVALTRGEIPMEEFSHQPEKFIAQAYNS